MYPSSQGTLNTYPIPGSKAYPLDQGDSNTCTCHAVANAVADQLVDANIDIDQRFLAYWLVANNQTIGNWISLKLTVREVESFSNADKHVLAYYTPQGYHCVYVKQQSENYYECVNSWKDDDPFPKVDLGRRGNRLWRVRVELKPPPVG